MNAATVDQTGRLKIWLLGGFRVSVAGRVVEATAWRRRKARSLVKLLALAPGHALHRDQVIDLLWPDLEPKAAANNLYQALHLARRALAPDGEAAHRWLQVTDGLISLCPQAPLWIDVERFEAAATAAQRHDDPAAFRAALDCYAGDLLPEDRYEDWTAGRREALRQTRLALLNGLALLCERRGDHEAALEALRKLLAMDSTNEDAHRLLMRVYAANGRRSEAACQYEHLREALARELGAEPDAESRRLHEQILAGRAGVETSGPKMRREPAEPRHDGARHHLPAQLTSFVGRRHAIGEVRRLLATARLLVLTGPGGCGKTRLAVEAASGLVPVFPDGVWLVDLAALTDPESVPRAAASALGVREVPGQPVVDNLAGTLRSRHLLLVLDNCEHLVEACARLAEHLVRTCPEVRILATSREPLRVAGEVTWLVPSLSLPDPRRAVPVAELARSEAVRLFLDRAALVRPGFELIEEDGPALAQVCYRLDGLPLAIELAAARVRVLSLRQIAARLDDRFRLLTGGSRTALTRQQTLRATLDWSHDLLGEPEQIIFRRLAVCAGDFGLEAAEAVGSGDSLDPAEVLDVLGRLVAKSLVAQEERDGEARYRLLETIRQYALERLRLSGEAIAVRARHAGFFLALAEAAAPELRGARQAVWLDRLEAEHDNLRAALEWSRAADGEGEVGLRLAGALAWFWQVRGHLAEGHRWLELVLNGDGASTPSAARTRALLGTGALTFFMDDFAAGRRWLEASLAAAEATADGSTLAQALAWLALLTLFQGDPVTARDLAMRSLTRCRELGEEWGVALVNLALGFADVEAGDHATARARAEESLAGFRRIGDHWGSALARRSLASIAYRQGDEDAAWDHATQALALERQMRDPWLVVQSLSLLGEIARAREDFVRAAALSEQSLTLSREVGHRANAAWALRNLGYVAVAQRDAARAAGRLAEALAIFQETGYRLGIACCLVGFAAAAVVSGAFERAARLSGAADAVLASIGGVLAPADRLARERALAALRAALPARTVAALTEEGRTMTVEEAVAAAQHPIESDPRP